jgi:GMP synthase (glutamine-hydrolysing)
MKLLVVNNHSDHIKELLQKFKEVELIDFENLTDKSYDFYDAIILSGSSSLSVVNHKKEYSRELDLIKKSKKPILGICLGFELINFAFGEELKSLEQKEKGVVTIKLVSKDRIFESLPKEFKVYEAHRWVVTQNKSLKSLAKSKDGIEAVKHPKKEIYGVQFHPEVFVDKGYAEKIFRNFLVLGKLPK